MIQHSLISLGLRWYKGYLIWKHGLGYWVWIILKSTVICTSIFNVLVTSTVQYRSLTSDKVVTRRPSLFFLQIHMKYYRLCHKCLCLSVPKDDWPGGADQRLPLSERVFASIRTYDLLSAFLSLKTLKMVRAIFKKTPQYRWFFCHVHPIWPRYFFSM